MPSATRRRTRGLAPGAWFALPLAVVFVVFYVWPAVNTIIGSLFKWSLLSPWRITDTATWDFVGLDNYISEVTSGEFWSAVVNTLVWLFVFPTLVVLTSLFAATAIWQIPRGGRLFRTAFILPMSISLAAAGIVWTFMYDPDFGTLPAILDAINVKIDVDVGWFSLRSSAFLSDPGHLTLGPIDIRFINLSLIIAAFWAFTGFGVITVTAGLSGLDQTLIEAAVVDGASTPQLIRYIIVPSLRSSLIVVGAISVIFSLRTFDVVWVITQGGPVRDSEVLAVRLWKEAFVFLDRPQAGSGTAIAVMISIVLAAFSVPYLRSMIRGSD